MKKIYLSLFFLTMAFYSIAQSNLFIDNSYTIEEMVQDFFDNPAVTISNVSFSGDPSSVAFFDAGDTDLGLGAGILFTTGATTGVADAASVFLSESHGTPGDIDLNYLMGGFYNYDGVIIEFDFTVAVSDTFDFNYVFGSEEYPEFTCTQFNDAFGFLISGPGIVGPYSNNAINICMVPNSMDAVAINTINDNPDCGDPAFEQYYIDNETGQHVVYDGFTTPIPASFYAVEGETYHAKLLIGDGSDSAFDSGVFLSVNSLGADSLLVPPSQFSAMITENVVEFTNTSKYAREWSWDFGNGVVSDERHPVPVHYETPGTYTITLTTTNYCCSDTYEMTVEVGAAPLVVSETVHNNPLACFGDQNASVEFDVSGGVPPYTIVPGPGVPGNENLGAGTYEYYVSDAINPPITVTITITEPEELTLDFSSTPALEGQSDGSATAIPAGGVVPYTYLWSDWSTAPTLGNLPAGSYAVTITDANGCTIEGEAVVDMTTSVSNIALSSDWRIAPNPVDRQLNISNLKGLQAVTVKIFDVVGRVHNPEFEIKGNVTNVHLPDHLNQGVYLLHIEASDGNFYVTRFVKE